MSKAGVMVIGAGPAGLAAARHLAGSGKVSVTLIQRDGLASFLPGILPVLLGMKPISLYRHQIALPGTQVVSGDVIALESGRVYLADGTVLNADALIAAPGLVTDTTAIPAGTRNFAVWELDGAEKARQAVQSFTGGRVVVAITSLPYRCPPAPYGLALALKALFQQRNQAVEVVLVTPEARPIQALGDDAANFLEALLRGGNVMLQTAFHLESAACRDGLLVATDGRQCSYDLGLFIPPHRRPALLKTLPGNGALVQVDAHQRTAMDMIWVAGDVAATPLPRAAGVAEAQGRTAAASVLAVFGLNDLQPAVIPAPTCYVWASQSEAARIQLRFPDGLPPTGKPELLLDPPDAAIFTQALEAQKQWLRQLQ
ncbi:MAG TPA: FAD/NAD(P)-binding oxidoreductase [Ktedonobacteraceae bacterium]|nr:FAD/NAD(P)-binding oxidoreductase [Ktedonobacteraceae bacterium]